MTINRLVICAVGLYAALSAAAASQDRPNALRLTELVSELEGDRFEQAMEELTAAGSAAVPYLVTYLTDPNKPRLSHIRAVRVLGRIGAPATGAVPHLLGLLPEKALQPSLVVALGRIGPYARQHVAGIRRAMVAEMASESLAFVTITGGYPVMAETFSRTLLDPTDSTGRITQALHHENPFVRAFAAEVLFTRGEVNELLIVALHKAATEPHPKEVYCDSPGLTTAKLEVDLDRRIHRLAARALVHVAPQDPRSLAGHRIMIDVVNTASRLQSVMALGHLGSIAAPAVPQLLILLKDDLPVIKREAVTTLGMIGPDAASAIPALEKLTEQEDRQILERASAALRQIRGK